MHEGGQPARPAPDTRRRLLDAGMALFIEDGIYTTRIDAVTERAHVAKGTFYTHFESKEALVAELLQEGIEILEHRYLDGMPAIADADARLAELARRHEAFQRDEPGYSILLHQSRGLMLVPRPQFEPLRNVLHRYLRTIGARLAPPGAGAGLSDEHLIELASGFACALFGRRSFTQDAGTKG